MRSFLLGLLAVCLWPAVGAAQPGYAWLTTPVQRTLETSIAPPEGFRRVAVAPDSFGAWLRRLPLKAEGAPVLLFDGRRRPTSPVRRQSSISISARGICSNAPMR